MDSPAPLPPNPNLRQLRHRARELQRAHADADSDALARIGQSHPRFARSSPEEIADAEFLLADAQLVIARECGFNSWPKLKKQIESATAAIGMHELVTRDDLEAMKTTVAADPQSVDEKNASGLPPFYTAARCRNEPALEFLLSHGATVDIFACAYLGRAADAESLLQDDASLVHSTTPDGMTPLHYAARAGHRDVADVLLRYGADVNARDDRGRTAVIEASHGGPWKHEPADDVIALLLDAGAEIDLFNAAAMGRADLIASILDADGTQIDRPNRDGHTALFIAAQNNRLPAVQTLVERGADVNRCDAVGIAALHRTSQQCSDELIRYLIEHGADAHLCCYVACGDADGTRAELTRHPKAAAEIFYEFNAIQYAIHCWQPQTLRVLLEHGCVLTEEDQRHILRICGGDREILKEILAIRPA